MNRSVIKLATAGLFVIALGLGMFVWHTRYRILPLEAGGPQEHQLRTHLSSDQFCSSAMKATEQRYLRPVFTLTGALDGERIAFGLRKERIDWAELPRIFDSFRTQSERTVFVVAEREQNFEKIGLQTSPGGHRMWIAFVLSIQTICLIGSRAYRNRVALCRLRSEDNSQITARAFAWRRYIERLICRYENRKQSIRAGVPCIEQELETFQQGSRAAFSSEESIPGTPLHTH